MCTEPTAVCGAATPSTHSDPAVAVGERTAVKVHLLRLRPHRRRHRRPHRRRTTPHNLPPPSRPPGSGSALTAGNGQEPAARPRMHRSTRPPAATPVSLKASKRLPASPSRRRRREASVVTPVAVVVERPAGLAVTYPEVAQQPRRCVWPLDERHLDLQAEPAVLAVREVQGAARVTTQPLGADFVGLLGCRCAARRAAGARRARVADECQLAWVGSSASSARSR
jgi:hypothetical protein